MGDRKGQEKRNLEEIQDKQLDGAWPRAAPFGIFQHRYCHGLRSSGSSPCLLPVLGTSLFLSRGVLRLSINLFSFEGLPHCCGVSRFLGNYRELGCQAAKGHRSSSQLSPSLWQKLHSVSHHHPAPLVPSGRAEMFWICTYTTIKARFV